MAANISFEEFQGVQTALFEWAESYDTKDWARLHKILAPELRVDYRAILGKIWESMPSEEFVTMMSHENVLGSPTLKTQHFVGASVYERVTDTEIIGYHQMRVPHQKYKDAELSEIEERGMRMVTINTGIKKLIISGSSPVFPPKSDGPSTALRRSLYKAVITFLKIDSLVM